MELPNISSGSYVSNTYSGDGTGLTEKFHQVGRLLPQRGMWEDHSVGYDFQIPTTRKTIKTMPHEAALRIVQVLIADPDTKLPIDKRLLYQGDSFATDATDEELFYEISIKEILDKHNEYRKTVVDKSVKDRVEHLEPIRIRDLSMTVVTIAEFVGRE